jgi:hypothetical protein
MRTKVLDHSNTAKAKKVQQAQAPEVSDEQAITQAIKERRAGELHSHLVRELPKTLEGLYEEFWKFSRSEVSHYRKLDQQWKVTNENEGSRPFKYSKGKEGATSFNAAHKQIHSIDSDGCGPQKIWEKTSDLCSKKMKANPMTQEGTISKPRCLPQQREGQGPISRQAFVLHVP